MIEFVFDGTREQSIGLKVQLASVQRLGSDPNATRARHIGANARKTSGSLQRQFEVLQEFPLPG